MSHLRPLVSVVVPFLNEEAALAQVVIDAYSELSRLGQFEIILVDDGSRDNSYLIAQELLCAMPMLQLIRLEDNEGIGAALRAGYRVSTGLFLTWIPADGENSAEEIVSALQFIMQSAEHVDAVLLYPVNSAEVRSVARRIISMVFTFVIKSAFGVKPRYFNGTTIVSMAKFQKLKSSLKSTGFFLNAELVIRLYIDGAKVIERSTHLHPRRGSKSKAFTTRAITSTAKDFIRLLGSVKRHQ